MIFITTKQKKNKNKMRVDEKTRIYYTYKSVKKKE